MDAVNDAFYQQLISPLSKFLDNPAVSEISINQPGTLWLEHQSSPALERHDVSDLTDEHLKRLCRTLAAYTGQHVSNENPLLSTRLPSGERVQIVFPPVAANGIALSIRKQMIKDMSLSDYDDMGVFEHLSKNSNTHASNLQKLLDDGQTLEFLKQAVISKKTILISGGTSSGKTTFAKALLKEIPTTERLITIEDTQELFPIQPNTLALLASKGDQGTARVNIQDLLEASLRLRPDRILLGELRGKEAYSFLRAVNTGHPGSITTVHANSPQGAFHQLSMMVMQAQLGLTKQEILDYITGIIDVVVQLERVNGVRRITNVEYRGQQ